MTLRPHEKSMAWIDRHSLAKIMAWIDRHSLALSVIAAFLIVFIGWRIAWWMINPVPLQPYGCCELGDYRIPP